MIELEQIQLFTNIIMVLRAGIEPAHSEEYRILSPVRLPIPPPQHGKKINTTAAQVQN